jgi:hypothetical protein
MYRVARLLIQGTVTYVTLKLNAPMHQNKDFHFSTGVCLCACVHVRAPLIVSPGLIQNITIQMYFCTFKIVYNVW